MTVKIDDPTTTLFQGYNQEYRSKPNDCPWWLSPVCCKQGLNNIAFGWTEMETALRLATVCKDIVTVSALQT